MDSGDMGVELRMCRGHGVLILTFNGFKFILRLSDLYNKNNW